jgi:hypothetical protein
MGDYMKTAGLVLLAAAALVIAGNGCSTTPKTSTAPDVTIDPASLKMFQPLRVRALEHNEATEAKVALGRMLY